MRRYVNTVRLIVVLTWIILLIGCSTTTTDCPCFPRPNEKVKEELRPLQDKEMHPDTWAWFNQILKLKEKLPECN